MASWIRPWAVALVMASPLVLSWGAGGASAQEVAADPLGQGCPAVRQEPPVAGPVLPASVPVLPASVLPVAGPVSSGAVGAATATGKVTVWLAGDSTMARGSSPCPVGWGREFASYFTGDVTVVNSAMGGRSVQTWLYEPNVTSTQGASGECTLSSSTYSARWQAMLDASTGMKAGDYLFVQFGINDGDRTCPRHVGSERYKELLGMMVRTALDRGVHPVVLTPVAAVTCSGSVATANRGFLTETTAVAQAAGVPVIDLHRLSYGLYNTLRLCPDNNDYTAGAAGSFFCADHTHFEAAGARQIAGLVAAALREQGIGLAGYLV